MDGISVCERDGVGVSGLAVCTDLERFGTEWVADTDTLCLTAPRRNKAYYSLCMDVVHGRDGLSIDCRNVILLFGVEGLNREHIKL